MHEKLQGRQHSRAAFPAALVIATLTATELSKNTGPLSRWTQAALS